MFANEELNEKLNFDSQLIKGIQFFRNLTRALLCVPSVIPGKLFRLKCYYAGVILPLVPITLQMQKSFPKKVKQENE